jgi:hypothetical protein
VWLAGTLVVTDFHAHRRDCWIDRAAIQYERERASDSVRQIVPAARRMIDRIASAAGRAAFQRGELRTEPRMIEQFHDIGIERGQEVAMDVRHVTPLPERKPKPCTVRT